MLRTLAPGQNHRGCLRGRRAELALVCEPSAEWLLPIAARKQETVPRPVEGRLHHVHLILEQLAEH